MCDTETQPPLYIRANEIDNRRGVTLDTTHETLNIRLNKICEITQNYPSTNFKEPSSCNAKRSHPLSLLPI